MSFLSSFSIFVGILSGSTDLLESSEEITFAISFFVSGI